jgi:uncharacterized Zn finger protein (UPF0148 family)
MSDFDKEAEREKLREKYGDEEEKRAATEQMSELLLKGATMTNAHCTDCGDPIFRHDGQEFCPTCQKPVVRDQSDQPDEAEASDAESADDHIEVADPSDDAHVQFGDGDGDGDTDTATDDRPSEPHNPEERPESPVQSREIPSADPDRTPPRDRADTSGRTPSAADTGSERPADGTADRARSADPSGAVAQELSAAESLLAETVHRFARRASETDDPRVARDHLAAAREAAEALDTVRY